MTDSEFALSLTPMHRYLIMGAVILGSTLYATTLLIASTLLPQMQGTLAATADEISWAMTFNILATAVVTPMTGWLTAHLGLLLPTAAAAVWLATPACSRRRPR